MSDQKSCSNCEFFRKYCEYKIRRCLNPESKYYLDDRLGIWTCENWSEKEDERQLNE